MTYWRWIAILLIVLNGLLFGLKAIESPPPPAVTVAPVEPGQNSIQLVRETWSGGSETATRCFTLGPLPTLVQQQRAEDRLRPFASEIRIRRTEADRDRGWWVFLVAGDRAAALELAQDLARRGIDDYFVVADEHLPEAVSLGLFEDRANARQRLAEIRAMGLDAQLSVRREDVPQFWLDYSIEPDQRSPWRFIVRSSPGAKHFEIPCF